MKRLPLSLQLFAMFGTAVVLLVSILAFSVYQFSVTSDEYEDVITQTSAYMLLISKAGDDFHSGISEFRGFVAYGDLKYEEVSKQHYRTSREKIKEFAANVKSKEAKLEAEKLEKMLSEYIEIMDKLYQTKKANDPRFDSLVAAARNNTELINKQFDTVLAAQENALKAHTNTLQEKQDTTERLIIVLSLLILLSVSAAVLWYSRNMAGRINNVRAELQAISNFDLSTKDLRDTRNDEIGDIAEAMISMKQALRSIVSQLRHNADTLAASSQQLNATVEQQLSASDMVAKTASEIAAGSMQNTNNINDISATVQQVSAGAEEMAASAAQVNSSTQNAVTEANQGMRLIDRVVQQNETISQTMHSITEVSSSLVKGSNNIQEIITVIRNIAGQTNLLALNAAIEAARAGEAGRGFAVVAEEVRKLAEQSAEATNHIEEIIGKMTSDIGFAVQTVDTANQEVAAGKAVTTETQKGYQEIITKLGHVKLGILHIAKAVDETAKGMQTIVSGIQNISAVAEETTANTQTVAAASEEQTASMNEISENAEALASMAIELNEITRKFTL